MEPDVVLSYNQTIGLMWFWINHLGEGGHLVDEGLYCSNLRGSNRLEIWCRSSPLEVVRASNPQLDKSYNGIVSEFHDIDRIFSCEILF